VGFYFFFLGGGGGGGGVRHSDRPTRDYLILPKLFGYFLQGRTSLANRFNEQSEQDFILFTGGCI